ESLRLVTAGGGALVLGTSTTPGGAAVIAFKLSAAGPSAAANTGGSTVGPLPNPNNHGFVTTDGLGLFTAGLKVEIDGTGAAFGNQLYSYRIGQIDGWAGGQQDLTNPASFSAIGFVASGPSAQISSTGQVFVNFTAVSTSTSTTSTSTSSTSSSTTSTTTSTSSTTSSTASTSTSSTSTSIPRTTSTTLPGPCEGATFTCTDEHLDALIAELQASNALGNLQARLVVAVTGARKYKRAAEALVAAGKRRPAQAHLGHAILSMIHLGFRVQSHRAKHVITDAALRGRLRAEGMSIQHDLKTLRSSLRGR